MYEIVMHLQVDGAATGGPFAGLGYRAYHVKKLIERAVADKELPDMRVTGMETRNLEELGLSKPRGSSGG